MKTPIIITEDYDISIHPNLLHAETFLEPVDVKNRIYIGYDSEGKLLELSVVQEKKEYKLLLIKWIRRFERVEIRVNQPVEIRLDELRQKLIIYLEHKQKSIKPKNSGITQQLTQKTVQELINEVGKFMPWSL